MGDDEEPDEKPRRPGRPEQRVSLKPLEFTEALADLLATGKGEDQERESQDPS